MPFQKLHKWLSGSFVCRECGKEIYTMCFGFGEAICPECYSGERSFLFFDDTYWLNRVMERLLNHNQIKSDSVDIAQKLLHQNSKHPVIVHKKWLKRFMREKK